MCVSLQIHPNLHTVYACVRGRGGREGGRGGGGGGGCVFVCMHAFVRVGDSVCLSVCQFDFALYHKVCVVICYYANDFFYFLFMHSMLLFNLMTKRFEWPDARYKFHIIINISYVIISWLKH